MKHLASDEKLQLDLAHETAATLKAQEEAMRLKRQTLALEIELRQARLELLDQKLQELLKQQDEKKAARLALVQQLRDKYQLQENWGFNPTTLEIIEHG